MYVSDWCNNSVKKVQKKKREQNDKSATKCYIHATTGMIRAFAEIFLHNTYIFALYNVLYNEYYWVQYTYTAIVFRLCVYIHMILKLFT